MTDKPIIVPDGFEIDAEFREPPAGDPQLKKATVSAVERIVESQLRDIMRALAVPAAGYSLKKNMDHVRDEFDRYRSTVFEYIRSNTTIARGTLNAWLQYTILQAENKTLEIQKKCAIILSILSMKDADAQMNAECFNYVEFLAFKDGVVNFFNQSCALLYERNVSLGSLTDAAFKIYALNFWTDIIGSTGDSDIQHVIFSRKKRDMSKSIVEEYYRRAKESDELKDRHLEFVINRLDASAKSGMLEGDVGTPFHWHGASLARSTILVGLYLEALSETDRNLSYEREVIEKYLDDHFTGSSGTNIKNILLSAVRAASRGA